MTAYVVSSNQTSSGLTLNNGDTLTVSSGGIVKSITVNSGGLETIDAGGSANGGVISSGGAAIISAGGEASFTNIETGGTLILLPGAIASNTTGTAISSGDVLISGAAVVSSAASLANTLITSGEELLVLPGGFAGGALVTPGGEIAVAGGFTSATTILSGGSEIVSSGGYSISATVLSGGTEVVASGGTTVAPHLYAGAALDLAFAPFINGGSADLNYISDVLTITEGGATYSEQLNGSYTGEYFHLANDGAGGTLATLETVACYCQGTQILTDKGDVAVETLAIGDCVITQFGPRPVKWIGRRSYSGRFIMGRTDVLPVCIKAGALAANVPVRDLWISPIMPCRSMAF